MSNGSRRPVPKPRCGLGVPPASRIWDRPLLRLRPDGSARRSGGSKDIVGSHVARLAEDVPTAARIGAPDKPQKIPAGCGMEVALHVLGDFD
jgi:hypothetical protein